MQTIDNVIKFHTKQDYKSNTNDIEHKDLKETESMIAYPTEQEILVMNALVNQYADQNPDEMIPFDLWNGDCYHSLFDEMVSYAEEIGVDPWDAFALFIKKFYGWRMEMDDKGSVTVKHSKQ